MRRRCMRDATRAPGFMHIRVETGEASELTRLTPWVRVYVIWSGCVYRGKGLLSSWLFGLEMTPWVELAPKWQKMPRSVRRKEGERIYGRSDLLSGADIAILPSGKSVINDDCERRIVRDPSEARSTGKSHPDLLPFGGTGLKLDVSLVPIWEGSRLARGTKRYVCRIGDYNPKRAGVGVRGAGRGPPTGAQLKWQSPISELIVWLDWVRFCWKMNMRGYTYSFTGVK